MAFEYSSVYAASKFGLEGWMGALEQEIGPFGIHTTIVNPGFFRTGLASPESAEAPPPRRFIAGTDVLALVDRKITELSEQMDSHRDLSSSLAFDI